MMPTLKLGKLPKKEDKRNILFKNIVRRELLPPLPTEYDVDSSLQGFADTHMFANDRWGDCVIAARAHMTLRFEDFEQKKLLPICDNEVLAEYWKEQGDGSHPDNGLSILDSLKAWRTSGWATCGNIYNIYAFAEVDRLNHSDLQYAIYLLEGVQAGLQISQAAIDQFLANQTWDLVPNDGGKKGGHCVYLKGFNPTGLVCVTWAKKQQMTWAFWDKYSDESYGIVDDKDSWVSPETDPVDVVKLDGYLSEITSAPPNPTPSPCKVANLTAKISERLYNLTPWLLNRKGRFYIRYMNPPKADKSVREVSLTNLFPLAHFLGGIVAAYLSTKAPLAAIFLFIGFFAYEVIEFIIIKDAAWRDIRQFVVGLFLGALLHLLW